MATTSRGYRYPASSAAPNVPLDLANLASDLDTDVGNVAKTGTIVCTSVTRPSSPVAGQKIWQTDTSSEMVWTGSAWRRTGVFDVETIGNGVITEGTSVAVSSTSFIAGSPVCGLTFVAPPSGAVYVTVSGTISCASNGNEISLSWELRTGNVVGSGSAVYSASTARCITAGRAVNTGAAALNSASRRYRAGSLTAGSSYNVRTMHYVTGGTGTVDYRELLIEPVL